jgi:hypothetical protein
MTAPFDYADIHRAWFAFWAAGVDVELDTIALIEGFETFAKDA